MHLLPHLLTCGIQGGAIRTSFEGCCSQCVTAFGGRRRKGSGMNTDQIRGVRNDDVEGVGEGVRQLSRMVVVVECEV